MPFVDLKVQYLSIKNEIDSAIQSVIDQSAFIGGAMVKEFETAFESYTGASHCIGCANGTDAIEIALRALEVGRGDEVIIPALTWISTGGAVNNVGAEPIFIDVIEKERTIDPALIEDKITDKTKAIIPVHLYGLPARMNEILAVAKKYHLKVIEDCAQAHGAKIDGKKVGNFGDVATFSFYPGKNLGAYGDAGAMVTNDEALEQSCRMMANHGQMTKHDHRVIGRNSRLDTIQAAILNAKLPYIERWTQARIKHASQYANELTSVVTPIVPKENKQVFHLYVIQSERREELKKNLLDNDVGCAIHYPVPLPHLQSYAYKKHAVGEFPISEKLCSEILSLPMYAELDEEQVSKTSEIVNSMN